MIHQALSRSRLVMSVVFLLTVVGLASWSTMPRQEDPSFARRFASLIVVFPGGSVLDVERLIIEPIEEELLEQPELSKVRSTARPGVAIFNLRLADRYSDLKTDAAWDKVRLAIKRAESTLPAEAQKPVLDAEIGDPASVVVLITGSDDLLSLRAASKKVERRLRTVSGVKRVKLHGDPGRQIAVELSAEDAHRFGISAVELATIISDRNVTIPGGSLIMQGRTLLIQHNSELLDLSAVQNMPITMQNGSTVPLSSIATVRFAPTVPQTARVRHNNQPAVAVSVVAARNQDLVRFGERVQVALDKAKDNISPLQIEVFSFQPEMVQERLWGLTSSLIMGMVIVAIVLMLTMGLRMGLLVSAVVPLVAMGTIGLYAAGGGVLHQISIASLVLALGLLVDNAIVMAETVQQNLDAGVKEAGLAAVKELAFPLATATGTTVAAFLPMLLSKGGTAEFTRAIPVVVITALVLSYIYAIVVTPALAQRLLKRGDGTKSRLDRLGRWIGRQATYRPKTSLTALFALIFTTAGLAFMVNAEFFPMSDRPQMLVSIALPEGSHNTATEELTADFTKQMIQMDEVQEITAFIGGGLPRFYYNLNNSPSSPHRAEVIIKAHTQDMPKIMSRVRELNAHTPEAVIIAKRLQQGPPVGAPVQIQLRHQDLDRLAMASEQVVKALRSIEGTQDVESDLGVGIPTLQYQPDDAWLARNRSNRSLLALSTLSQTIGIGAGQIRDGADPINVQVSSVKKQHTPLQQLDSVSVSTIPLGQLAHSSATFAPASLHHHTGVRQVTISAQLKKGASYSRILSEFQRLDPDLKGIDVHFAGESEGSGEANSALLTTMPLGAAVLLFFLLLEFDSFRRLAIIGVTVPLAAVGVIPGLALTGQPFGFMSLLGVLALIGIVVNNAIVLLHRIETNRAEGQAIEQAVANAVQTRIRPIVLTTATTIAGMLPLAFSGSALWPPLAWAMVSGLAASTVLTLVAVPSLYQLLFGERNWPRLRGLWLLLIPSAASASPVNIEELLSLAEQAPAAQISISQSKSDHLNATTSWLDSLTPTLSAQVDARTREKAIALSTPIGAFTQQPKQTTEYGIRAQQPVFAPAQWAGSVALSKNAKVSRLQAERAVESTQVQAANLFYDLLSFQADERALGTQEQMVVRSVEVAEQLFEQGLVVESDVLSAKLALGEIQLAKLNLNAAQTSLHRGLQAVLGVSEPIEPVLTEVTLTPSLRTDLLAVGAAKEALSAKRTARALSLIPQVLVDVGWQGTNNTSLVDQQWYDYGVVAQWQLSAGKLSAVAQTTKELQKIAAQEHALSEQIKAEQVQTLEQVKVRHLELQIRGQAVEQAEKSEKIFSDRYELRLVTITDLLAAQAELAKQRSALDKAKIERARAQLLAALSGASVH